MIGGLYFTVRGLPVPQGSSRAFVVAGKARIVTKTARLSDWRSAIATAAGTVMGTEPLLDGPLTVRAEFFLPRPKSTKRVYPAVRPDLDKLARALLDGCTGVVWTDDSRVVDLIVSKRYGDAPGVSVEILPHAAEPFESRLERGSEAQR